jgi:hypothetical protein
MFNSMIDTLMLRSKWSFATVYMPRHAATGIRAEPFSRFGEQDQSSFTVDLDAPVGLRHS